MIPDNKTETDQLIQNETRTENISGDCHTNEQEKADYSSIEKFVNFSAEIFDSPDICRNRSIEIINEARQLAKDVLKEMIQSASTSFDLKNDMGSLQANKEFMIHLNNAATNMCNDIDSMKTEYHFFFRI